MLKRNYYVLIFLLIFITGLRSQATYQKGAGSVSGTIVDSISGLPVEYATIGLLRTSDKKIIDGTTSDDKGNFKITGIAEGAYFLQLSFIGYRTSTVNLAIKPGGGNIVLPQLPLGTLQNTLKEVEVTTEKSLIENKIDKMVYNADQDIISQGGVATDILKKVPQVSVDANGNVELQGNANIRFLINGKPSTMFGNNVADVLQSIPASQIQSIEVVTSPGAKYDAEGGGIINIILKKNNAQGFNGNVNLSAGSRLENGSVNLAARKGTFGVSAFFSGNAQMLSTTLNKMNRVSQDTALLQNSTLLQDGKSNFERNGFQTGISADWTINPKNSISASLSYNNFLNNTTGITYRQSLSHDDSGNTLSDVNSVINADNKFNFHAFDWNLNYKKSFKKEGQELEILYNASSGKNLSNYGQTQSLSSGNKLFSGSYGNNPGTDKQSNISINYTHPLSKDLTLETGVKTVISRLSSRSDIYLLNTVSGDYDYNSSQSAALSYNRNIYAGYVSGTFRLFDYLDVKAGSRYEYTETMADFSGTGSVYIRPYNTLVPSAVISHAFKNHQSLKLGYSRRISRPGYRDVNPFVNATDPKNLSMGNPGLAPETSGNLELGYNKIFDKGANVNLVVYYRGNYHDIQAYSRYYSSFKNGDSVYKNVTVSTRENIGTENNIGANLFASVPITSKINIRTNISGFQRSIYSIYSDGSIRGFMYRVNATLTYLISKALSFEVFGNFNSPRINAQGVQPSFTTYNFALRRQFLNKKGSLALTATNPFNKYVKQRTELNGNNFVTENVLQLPYRSFGVNFTYKFGKLEFKKQKETEDINLTNPPTPGN